MSKTGKKPAPGTIADNRKVWHEYHVLDRFEAGLMLTGWEVKSIRAGKAQIKESYVVFRKGDAYLIGAHISPLTNVAEHLHPDPTRTRKLLLNRREINKLMGQVAEQGLTVVPLNLHWQRGNVKLEIALVKGKKLHDKRADTKARDWQREKARIMKHNR